MRTLIIIAAGLIGLGVFATLGRLFDTSSTRGLATAALVFLPVWLAVALTNMYIGVVHAGYSAGEELPIMLGIFALPAAVALFLWWKFA